MKQQSPSAWVRNLSGAGKMELVLSHPWHSENRTVAVFPDRPESFKKLAANDRCLRTEVIFAMRVPVN